MFRVNLKRLCGNLVTITKRGHNPKTSKSLLSNQISWKYVTIGGGVISICASYMYVNWRGGYDQSKITQVFLEGQKFLVEKDDHPVERKAFEKALKFELIPSTSRLFHYILVCGKKGTGKTTTFRKIAREVKEGVVFVQFQEDQSLCHSLADGFGVRSKHGDFSLDAVLERCHVLPKLTDHELMSMINKAAMEYKKKNNGTPPTLLIDDIENLRKQPGGEDMIVELQLWAKNCAEKNLLRIVFITSDISTVDLLKKQKSASHMNCVEMCDMADDEAMQFVLDKLNPTTRKNIVGNAEAGLMLQDVIDNVIGGRALLLVTLAKALNGKTAAKEYCQVIAEFTNEYLIKVQDDFLLSDMICDKQSPRYKAMWRVANKLLSSQTGTVTYDQLAMSNANIEFLKNSSVFSWHQRGYVGFNTPAHHTFATLMSNEEKK